VAGLPDLEIFVVEVICNVSFPTEIVLALLSIAFNLPWKGSVRLTGLFAGALVEALCARSTTGDPATAMASSPRRLNLRMDLFMECFDCFYWESTELELSNPA
jgi:hypothetical protein